MKLRFCRANILENYHEHVDGAIYKEEAWGFNWLLTTVGISMILVSKGPFRRCLELSDVIVGMLDNNMAAVERNESKDYKTVEVLNTTFQLLPTYILLGLWDRASNLMRTLRFDVWDAPFLDGLWAGIADSYGPCLGSKQAVSLYINLMLFVLKGSSVASPEKVLSLLKPPETIVSLSQTHWARCVGNGSLLYIAALAAERIQQDDLAEFFAERSEDIHLQSAVLAGCRAVRARIAARKDDRDAAVRLWQSGATLVMEHKLPLYAVRLGQDCAGEEGKQILEEAATAMGSDPTDFDGLPGLMAPCT